MTAWFAWCHHLYRLSAIFRDTMYSFASSCISEGRCRLMKPTILRYDVKTASLVWHDQNSYTTATSHIYQTFRHILYFAEITWNLEGTSAHVKLMVC